MRRSRATDAAALVVLLGLGVPVLYVLSSGPVLAFSQHLAWENSGPLSLGFDYAVTLFYEPLLQMAAAWPDGGTLLYGYLEFCGLEIC